MPVLCECGRTLDRRYKRCRECYRNRFAEKYGAAVTSNDDMTEEELDRMIEEQMSCLPSWWARDERHHRHLDGRPGYVPDD